MTESFLNARTAAISRPPAPAKRWTRTRIIGHVLVAFWAALIIGLLLDLYAAWDIVPIQSQM